MSINNLILWRWLASLLVAFAADAWAGATNSAWFTRAWQSDEGLPGNTVVGVVQTPDGFLWVATQNSLVRFDGAQFKEFASAAVTGGAPGLSRTLLADRRGRLWLGKQILGAAGGGGGEVVCVGPEQTRVFTAEDGLPNLPVQAMAEDGEGAVWTGSRGYVSRIRDGHVSSFTQNEGLPGGGICHLASDGRGQLWFAQTNQVGVFRRGKFRTLLTLSEPPGALAGARSGGAWLAEGKHLLKYTGTGEPVDLGALVPHRPGVHSSVIYEDRQGRLWIGTPQSGLFLYNGSGFDEVDLPHHEILAMTEDREGSLWVGTRGGGLIRLRPSAFEMQDLDTDSLFEAVVSVCQDTTGGVWAVMKNGELAHKAGPHWNLLSAGDGWSVRDATCVTAAPEGGVWVGTRQDGLHLWRAGVDRPLTQTNGLAGVYVTALLTAPSGEVWIGTVDTNALQRLRDGQLQTFLLPQKYGPFGTLAVDASGRVWAATQGGMLVWVNGEALVNETTNTLGRAHPISSLCATPDGSLWIGYAGMGLGRLKQGRFTRFGKEQGLLDDYLMNIVADGRGRMWFAASRGLFSVEASEFDAVTEGRLARVRSVAYGRNEGLSALQGSEGRWPGVLRSTDGRLWIPMLNGLMTVDPARLPPNREPPPVVIERVVTDGRTAAADEAAPPAGADRDPAPLDLRQSDAHLFLPPETRQTELAYAALSYVSLRNVAFKYRLKGWDREWVDAGSRRVAYYNHIPPGDYRFEVIACNNDGVWNETGASLAITALPYFWKTWWFIGLALLAGLGAVGAAARQWERRRMQRRVDQLERTAAIERERGRIAKDIHDDLGASLTHIKLLGELAEGESSLAGVFTHTRKMADTTQDMARALDEIVWAVRPQNDTLESLLDYLSRAADEFFENSRIRCRQSLSRPVPACAVSSEVRHNLFLAFREALNNAGKHAAATEVSIDLAVELPLLRVTVRDNGTGFDPAAVRPGRNGLANLRQRLAEIGGHCEILSQPGAGTTVTMEVVLKPLVMG